MNEESLRKYADVLLSAVGLREGQKLLVRGEPVHARFAGIVAERAYARGARYVRFDNSEFENPYLYSARVRCAREEYLEEVPSFRLDFQKTLLEEKWALIAIRTPEDPDVLAGLDPARNARVARATAEAMKPYQRRISSNEIAWLVAFMPTEKLAAKIMGMEAGPAAVDALWEVLQPILRLDREDPAAFWVEHGKTLAARAATLNGMAIDGLRFSGPGTDLFVGLSPRSLWAGGPGATKDGTVFNPNIPTEEVFTSPDARRTEGRVRFTRPVLIPTVGKIVEGGSLEFRAGELVGWDAERGKDALDTYFSIDSGARRLGEVALVDGSSPIYAAGRVFYNILFDENAACHIALGSAYPGCFRDSAGLDDAGLEALGGSVSAVHTDFMIGGPEVDVTALAVDGREIPVIRGGFFVV